MSDTTMNLCGNIMLKSVKMHFSVIPKFGVGLKGHSFFTGFRIRFIFQIGSLEIVKNRLAKKESEINFLKEKCASGIRTRN